MQVSIAYFISGNKGNRPAHFAKFRIRNVKKSLQSVEQKRKKIKVKVFTAIDLISVFLWRPVKTAS